ncbi:SAM-dependent methyltransferase [uncultured Gammaproteobacteria bacterium]|uniref:class I SAM-dependent methyltransferase n=1 Tax=Bathymodiolus heckerae thiotrophic gill symbiont TaxID=1052212 RepID=UPI0010B197EC|nr:class I SAM-dependent methyltransferase [Bathymodiolus heckerae thiotrophic gill symbiont]CAC9960123.1 SAM-dependent methyltransferase [uncultured Gammaproteobacteria bacterium]CAC9962186.1 SAM-dependent methyltransferase [uncultured Gammaproteobacteria bacterium]SHN92594.1 SAM-dependent methyltransferase [Bathymodiolus heckerae thiotrophic gill symbiont]
MKPEKHPFEQGSQTAQEAIYDAQKIAFSPMTFQAVRIAWKRGLLKKIDKSKGGLTPEELSKSIKMSLYGVKVLLESCLSVNVVSFKNEKYFITKTGKVFLYSEMTQINMNYNHDVNYLGMFYLEESIDNAKPEGLRKIFGSYDTIYPALTSLPEPAKSSWFAFDHYYSDIAFPSILPQVFKDNPKKIMDIGGNTGKFSIISANYNSDVNITIVDILEQLAVAKTEISKAGFSNRIDTIHINMLDHSLALPKEYDVIWMSQFLDCFGDNDIINILKRAASAISKNGKIFILETYWDNQEMDKAAFCIVNTSLYFTALANGTSRMYRLSDMLKFTAMANLKVTNTIENTGMGHTLLELQLKN